MWHTIHTKHWWRAQRKFHDFPYNKTILLYLANHMQSFDANSIFIMFDYSFIRIQISLCPIDAYVSSIAKYWAPCGIVKEKTAAIKLPGSLFLSPWERGWNSHNAIDLLISFSWCLPNAFFRISLHQYTIYENVLKLQQSFIKRLSGI